MQGVVGGRPEPSLTDGHWRNGGHRRPGGLGAETADSRWQVVMQHVPPEWMVARWTVPGRSDVASRMLWGIGATD